MTETLPEGTDHVIPGAANNAREPMEAATSARDRIKAGAADLKGQASAHAADLKGQATDKAKAYAQDGKARASAGLESVAKLIDEQAAQIDDKLGIAYGDYARRAASAMADFSDTLREKDVEELLEDARDLVRRSPAVAIGAAAAAGFVISRIIKAGSDMLDESPKTGPEHAEVASATDISAGARKAPKPKPKSAS